MRGSPFWQMAFLFAGVIFLLWQTWRGWRAGLFRGGVTFAAIVISSVLGLLAAELAAAPFGGLRYLSGCIAGVFAGGLVGAVLFLTIWLLGALSFKRTDHHAFGPLRLVWGVGGAFFGFLIGLAVLFGGISIVRSLGALAEPRVASAEPAEAAEPPAKLAAGLVTLKKSLELGSTGRLLESADLVSPQFYELATEIGKLTSDPAKMLRFLDYPGIQEVVQNPRVIDLFADPEVLRAWQSKNILAILDNKSVAAALKDPVLAQQLKKVDLAAALKFALESPPPSPSPSPPPSPKKHR